MPKKQQEKPGVASHSQEKSKVKTTLHLRLTYEDWKECFKTLTRAELGIFLAIRTLDPYGDRALEIDCSALGKELELHRTSVSRALESLSKKQLIDLEIVKVKVKQKVSNRKLTLLNNVENTRNNEQEEEKETCAPTHSNERPRTSRCADAQPIAPTHTSEHPRTQKPPEPLQHKDSSTPHTIKTYSDFIQTLSDSERANFLTFCEGKTKNLRQPVNDIEAWLAHTTKAGQNRWEVYYEKFLVKEQAQSQKSQGSTSSRHMAKKFQQEIEQQRQQAIETLRSKT